MKTTDWLVRPKVGPYPTFAKALAFAPRFPKPLESLANGL